MIATLEPTIDDLIDSSLVPRVPWPRRQMATRIVTDYNGLQAAIDEAKAGDIIAMRGPRFRGITIEKTWGRRLREAWNPHDRRAQVVTLINGNQDGTRPMIEGIAIWDMNPGSELWTIGCNVKPGEWQEPPDPDNPKEVAEAAADPLGLVWKAGAYCFGTFITGMEGTLRFKDCTFYGAEHSKGYGGWGLKAAGRTCKMGLHFENCSGAPDVIPQEQWLYGDNTPFLVIDRCNFGPCGRSHVQCGTRKDFEMPVAFLGILVQKSRFFGGFCGSANAACLSFHGYPGLVVIKETEIESNGWDGLISIKQKDGSWKDEMRHLDPTAGVAAWRAYNFGGAELDAAGQATSTLVLDNVKISLGQGGLDACTLEWVNRGYFRNLDTTGSADGAHWVNMPGQFAPEGFGIQKLLLYGPLNPPIREHTGDSESKTYKVWGPEDFAKHTAPVGKAA